MTHKSLDIENRQASTTFFKTLSTEDFLTFGVHDWAYIRPVAMKNGQMSYAIHAADGTPLSVMESLEQATLALKQNDLQSATVQ